MKPVVIENLPLGDLGLPTKWRDKVALFSVPDAALLMDWCAKCGIAVLGVEGFRIEGDHRIPDLDVIADFSELMKVSGSPFTDRSIAALREFLLLIPRDDVLLEFVLIKP